MHTSFFFSHSFYCSSSFLSYAIGDGGGEYTHFSSLFRIFFSRRRTFFDDVRKRKSTPTFFLLYSTVSSVNYMRVEQASSNEYWESVGMNVIFPPNLSITPGRGKPTERGDFGRRRRGKEVPFFLLVFCLL